MADVGKASQTRVFVIPFRASPLHEPEYIAWGGADGFSEGFGESTSMYVPSATAIGDFDEAGETTGEPERPSIPVRQRWPVDALTYIKELAKMKCPFDVLVVSGACHDPRNYLGYEKVTFVERGRFNDMSSDRLTALGPDEEGLINVTGTVGGAFLYEKVRMSLVEVAKSTVATEVVSVSLCDSISCGDCGPASTGRRYVYAIAKGNPLSVTFLPYVIFTDDGYATSGTTNIDTMAADEEPDDSACVGPYLVVISDDTESLHYAELDDIQDGAETWTEVDDGFVALAGPLAIDAPSSRDVWIVGTGGYVYYSNDITAGVVVIDDGTVADGNDLYDVHAFDLENIVAVGDDNTVIFSQDGEVFAAVLGPAPGIGLMSVFMRSAIDWFVGAADGNLYYTPDAGAHWYQSAFPGDGAGIVARIVFATWAVGFISHNVTAPADAGRILGTVDGGYSWLVLPEQAGAVIPANDQINDIAVMKTEPNYLFAGGLADDGADGIIIRGVPVAIK